MRMHELTSSAAPRPAASRLVPDDSTPGLLRIALPVAALAVLLVCPPVWATAEKASRLFEDGARRLDRSDTAGAIEQLKLAIKEDDGMLQAHLLLGKALLRGGQINAALGAFEEAMRRGVSPQEVAPALGQVYLLTGEWRKLLERFTPPAGPPKARAEVLALRGTAQAMDGDAKAAARSFEEARAADPRAAAPYVAEAPLALLAGDLQRAAQMAAKAVELEPDSALALAAQGGVLRAAGRAEDSLAAYDRAIARDGRLAEARVARAGVLMELRRSADAAKDLEYLAREKLEDPRVAYLRAMIAQGSGDTAAAKSHLLKAAQMVDAMPPTIVFLHEYLALSGALAHYALRNLEKARFYLEGLAGKTRRSGVPRKLLASIYIETRDFERAAGLVQTLMRESPRDPQVLFMQGALRMGQRQYAQAAESFQAAVAAAAQPAAIRALGISQIALGRDDVGFATLEKAFAANPRDLIAGMELATTYASRRQDRKALQVCEAMLKTEPGNPAILNLMATLKTAAGDTEAARGTWDRLVAADARFRPAVLNLARLDQAAGQIDAARKRLSDWITAQPGDIEALFDFGILEARAGRTDEAIALWRRATELDKRDIRAPLAEVELLAERGRADKAVEAGRALVARFPGSIVAMLALARAQVSKGDLESARATLDGAGRLPGLDPDAHLGLARALALVGDPKGAATSLGKALAANPDNLAALTFEVELEATRGDAVRADAALARLFKLAPRSASSLVTRGNLAMMRGKFTQALADYQEALAREPSTAVLINVVQANAALGQVARSVPLLERWLAKKPRDHAAWMALAEVQQAGGRIEDANTSYRRALELQPDNVLTLNNLAMVALARKDPEAVKLAEKAYALMPGSPDIMDTLGWIHVNQGSLETGLRHLRDARIRRPSSAEIRFHLAFALHKAGKPAEAREELGAALASGSGIKALPAVKQLQAALGL